MALDPSIPLQVRSPDPMGTLSSVLGIQRQQQENAQAGIALKERQGVQGVLSNIKNYTDANGNVDLTKLTPDIMSVAPTTGSQVLANVAQQQTAAITAKQSWSDLSDSTRQRFGKIMTSLAGQKPDTIASTFQSLSQQPEFQAGLPAIQHFWTAAVQPALQSGNQAEIDQAMYRVGKMGETASTQQGMNTPGGVGVSDNTTSSVVSTKPGTDVPPGAAVPGTAVTLKPGPGTPTVDAAGTQGIVGAPQADFTGVQGAGRPAALAAIAASEPGSNNSREALNVIAGRPQGFVPSSLPAGQAQNIGNNFDEMNRHFAGLQDQAAGNQLVTGLTGNIKALATRAITGTGSDKLAYANGLISTFLPGQHKVDDLKTATDLLDKNVSQLALGTPGGSTDAARALIGAARPNSHMTPEAIGDAADQVASQVRANVAMRNILQSYKMMGDVQGYASARTKLENIADPRVFQFEAADDAGRRKLLSNLTPDDRTQLRGKIQAAEEMGLVK